jgi:hypothetical protein
MHDKIKELMGQTLDEKFAGTWSVMDLQDLTKFAEKFAELIVNECIDIVDAEVPGMIGVYAMKKMSKHFGVKE